MDLSPVSIELEALVSRLGSALEFFLREVPFKCMLLSFFLLKDN